MRGKVKEESPAAIQARRDFGVFLRDMREKAHLSRLRLEGKTGIGVSRISYFEKGECLPESEEISQYIKLFLQVGISPDELLERYFSALDIRSSSEERQSVDDLHFDIPSMRLTDSYAEEEVFEQARSNAKALLVDAYWLPSRAQIRINLIRRYEEYSAECEATLDFCLQSLSDAGLTLPQQKEYLKQFLNRRIKRQATIKAQCTSLAREASLMLKRYKKVDEVFETYAGDLPGYALTKKHYYFGLTLEETLQTERYSARWAQTLQKHTLTAFQKRVESAYVERGIGPEN